MAVVLAHEHLGETAAGTEHGDRTRRQHRHRRTAVDDQTALPRPEVAGEVQIGERALHRNWSDEGSAKTFDRPKTAHEAERQRQQLPASVHRPNAPLAAAERALRRYPGGRLHVGEVGEIRNHGDPTVGSTVELERTDAGSQHIQGWPPRGEQTVVDRVESYDQAVRPGIVTREQPTRELGGAGIASPRGREGQSPASAQRIQRAAESPLSAQVPVERQGPLGRTSRLGED